MVLMLIKGSAGIVGFPCITILLTNSAPSLRILGTLNGFATLFSGVGRAIGPLTSGNIFTWGVKRGYIIPAFWFLGVIALCQVIPTWMIVEGEGPSRAEDTDDDDDDDVDEASEDEDARAIIAGDAADLHGVREDVIPEPEQEEADGLQPLERMGSRGSRKGNVGGYGTLKSPVSVASTRLRRMSAAGKDIE